MKFYRLQDAPLDPDAVVFRESSRLHGLATGAMLLATLADAAFVYRQRAWLLGVLSVPLMALVTLIFGAMFIKTLRATNWVLRAGSSGLLIKFASYLNAAAIPDDMACAVLLERADVASLRRTRVSTSYPAHDGVNFNRQTFLDIRLNPGVDVETLRQHLAAAWQAQRQAKGTRWDHRPVRMEEQRVVRVEWSGRSGRLAPGIAHVMEVLSQIAPVEPEARLDVNLVTPLPADIKEAEDQIIRLVETGGTVAAINLVRRTYGLSLSEAKDFVDELAGRS